MTWPELVPYLVLIVPSAGLALLAGAIRWRYLRTIRLRLHPAGAPSSPAPLPPPPRPAPRPPLDVGDAEAAPPLRAAAADARTAAARRTRAMRGAFVAALVVHCAAGTLEVAAGFGTRDTPIAVGVAIGYAFTAPVVVLIPLFIHASWRGWVVIPLVWVALDYALIAATLRRGLRDSLWVLGVTSGMATMPLVGVLPFASRIGRTLLVLLAPVALAVLAVAAALPWTLRTFDPSLSDRFTATMASFSVTDWAFTLTGAFLGIVLAARAVRQRETGRWAVVFVALVLLSVPIGEWVAPPRRLPLQAIGSHGLQALGLWWIVRGCIDLKHRGWLTDDVLQFLFCTALLSIFPAALGPEGSGRVLWAALPFAAGVLTLAALLLLRRLRAGSAAPPRMLLLRVFGRGREGARLLDLLDDSWRRLGRVDLVVGHDVAMRTLSARALEHFLLGRAHQQYVRIESEARQRVAALPDRLELDGRYPLNEIHCLPDMWQPVVSLLAQRADVVLLDLRGLTAANQGALFELSLVVERVPLERVVVLADGRTDTALLAATARAAWAALPEESPNHDAHDSCLEIVHCGRPRRRDEDAIVRTILAAAFAPA